MLDFLKITSRSTKSGIIEIYPKFIITRSKDLMIRGGDFYAIWDDAAGLWSTDEQDVIRLIDAQIKAFVEENKDRFGSNTKPLYMWDAETRMIDNWHHFCQKQMRDTFHMLDEKLIFINTPTNKKDYASKRLSYPLEPCPTPAYDKLISTLYSEEERHKIEWCVGSIITGDSKTLQKFAVFYGSAGTGKSTIINIIQKLFEGYYSVFDAKALGSSSNQFALESFKTNPLVAIQHDGDLSRIEDNTRLNSLVSHEMMTVNEKFKSNYANQFKCFLLMGTNKPVKITDAKSGLIRRLIDISPTGKKLSAKEYRTAVSQVNFELGGIACHCRDVYLDDPNYYDDYIPIAMLGASNDFYNYVIDMYSEFKKQDGTTLKASWAAYKTYCEDAKVAYALSQRNFKEELKNYFWEYNDRYQMNDGSRVRSYYSGFRTDKFEDEKDEVKQKPETAVENAIKFKERSSEFDKLASEYTAQYASRKETPQKAWVEVKTKLSDLDTTKLHYVKVPENHIVIDFDLKGPDGKKSFERNLEAASKWPPTYAELSKSGSGIHLHYIYTGDPNKLSRVYDNEIEIKVYTGDSSLRRKLTVCNDLPIANISSGLPLKEDSKLLNKDVVQTERGIRTTIKKCLNKEVHPGTKSNVDFIDHILKTAYDSGLKYDVTDMRNAIFAFAAGSTNQSETCIKIVNRMNFKSEEASIIKVDAKDDSDIVFYDVEVFPNLFLVNFKRRGPGNPITRLINPTSADIETLMGEKLVGFNCRRYDNHMLYARLMGYTNLQLYELSQKIIDTKKLQSRNCFFSEAYNISYTDIYDFASAENKKSLKKLEIEMGIHHQELGLPWDEPVPEELWVKVAEYCDNDVIATEAAFDYLSGDWMARQILADLADMSPNDTTNTLTTKIIFSNNRKPQGHFQYRDLSKPVTELDPEVEEFLRETFPKMMEQKHFDRSRPIGNELSLLPYFGDYKYENGKSTYRGEDVGEGGFAQGKPGMYGLVALLDVMSMHPHSVLAECLFGPEYSKRFHELVYGRITIKHEDWDEINDMLGGKLTKFVARVKSGEITSKALADALKTAINSVYGLTSASFDNPFRDIRNKDNIVAKRGALFMIDLKNAVLDRGFEVAHIKTDSIKIPDATPEIIKFVTEFGEEYGYFFEHEATYDRMCLVNDAVYIAKYKDADSCKRLYGYIPGDNAKHGGEWTATGKQFAVPYVHKKLFTKEDIVFEDLCETFSVTKGDLYLDMNENLPDVSEYEKQLAKYESDYRKGKLSDTSFESLCAEIKKDIDPGHDYMFVGRVGQFTPVMLGACGGELCRIANGKAYSATGAKGYRWLESEKVKELDEITKQSMIDFSFYNRLVDDAIQTIADYGDFEWFISDDPYVSRAFIRVPENAPDEVPFL